MLKHLFWVVRMIGWGIQWLRGVLFITYTLSQTALFNNTEKWRGGWNVHVPQNGSLLSFLTGVVSGVEAESFES